MQKLMRTTWWKILTVCLLVYSVLMGLLLPVGPGISHISQYTLRADSTYVIEIQGYNTHFKATDTVLVRIDSTATLVASIQEYRSETEIQIAVTIPMFGGEITKTADLILNSEIDGLYGTPNAFQLIPKADTNSILPSNQIVIKSKPSQYVSYPYRTVLYESIRNIFFHVPLWFAMTILLLFSCVYSIQYLRKQNELGDSIASATAHVAVLFGILGFATGSLWGNYTWGNLTDWLLNDTKILGAMLGVLIYIAYFILRSSLTDLEQKRRISAVYNVLAFVMFIVFIYIMPRMASASLHPGNANNPAFSAYDLDGTMRLVFYPAVLGYILLGLWIASIRVRISTISNYFLDKA